MKHKNIQKKIFLNVLCFPLRLCVFASKSFALFRWLALIGLWLGCSLAALGAPNQQPMPVDQAFVASAKLFGNDTVVMQWQIAPGHYLYRDRFHIQVTQPTNASIGAILYPPSQTKYDDLMGDYEIYANVLSLPIPIIHPDPHNTQLIVSYQGCSEDGYCYPPTSQHVQINFTNGVLTLAATSPPASASSTLTTRPTPAVNTQQLPFFNLLNDQHVATLLLAFLGFGILLSFTPCVLPMIPILSGIIIGHQKTIMAGKTFRLSLVYVLSMAVTYAIAGMLVGWMGGSIQALFQQTWVIVLFSVLFVVLALAFFGVYSLRLPAKLEERLAAISRHQKSGHYLGVAVMGCVATLIVSPCVTPALVGVLGYIAQTGNAALGGAALFALGLGMGLPLLAIGVAGARLLPRAGAWMTLLEHLFGVLFLAMAIWMLSRVIPAPITLLLWATLLIGSSVYMGALSTPTHSWGKLWKGLGLVLLVYGVVLIIGSAQGNSNPLRPLNSSNSVNQPGYTTSVAPIENLGVKNPGVKNPGVKNLRVKNLAEANAAIQKASASQQPIFMDFYADWCISCQVMERTVFQDSAVQAAMAQFSVIQADVTANNASSRALMQHFQVVAPPTFLVFDKQGQPLTTLTRVGEMSTPEFLIYLQQALANTP